jgi:hypothetical protein
MVMTTVCLAETSQIDGNIKGSSNKRYLTVLCMERALSRLGFKIAYNSVRLNETCIHCHHWLKPRSHRAAKKTAYIDKRK